MSITDRQTDIVNNLIKLHENMGFAYVIIAYKTNFVKIFIEKIVNIHASFLIKKQRKAVDPTVKWANSVQKIMTLPLAYIT